MRPVLQWLATTVAAALTDEGGGADQTDSQALAELYPTGIPLRDGQKVKRGPDWKWGDQDGGCQESSGEHAVGTVLEMKGSGWCQVVWATGAVESYRAGAEGGEFGQAHMQAVFLLLYCDYLLLSSSFFLFFSCPLL